MSSSSRVVAIRALVRIEGGAFANVALPTALRGTDLSVRDRAQVTDWVYGTTRWQRTLDYFLSPFVDRPVAKLDPPVRAGLRLGAYQLWGGVSPHAAVGETVAAMQAVSPRAKGFVNAVLRKLAAAGPPWPLPTGDDVQSVGVRTSMPDWIVAMLDADLGVANARAMLDAVNESSPVTLRVNPRRATPEQVEAELTAVGASVARGGLLSEALLVSGAGDLGALGAIREGRATPQDQASTAVAAVVAARPGDRVLEIGAAPGGKTTALAEAMGDAGLVVGLDVHAGRTRMIGDVVRRLGLTAVHPVVANALPHARLGADSRRARAESQTGRGDVAGLGAGSRVAQAESQTGRVGALPFRPGSFDRVLLDAPCSGLGVLRRRPEARWRLRPEQIDELAELQRELLLAAAEMVRPGGRLVYSVCTLSAAETIGVDEWASEHLPTFTVARPPGQPWSPIGRGARLLPQVADTDGMYCLVLQAPG